MIFLIVFRVAVRVGICILFRPYRDGNTSEYAAFLPVWRGGGVYSYIRVMPDGFLLKATHNQKKSVGQNMNT